VLMIHNPLDKANKIFNADESGFSDKTKGKCIWSFWLIKLNLILLGPWVIVNSSCWHVFEVNGGSAKDYRMALIRISAGGQVLPPFILCASKYLINAWCRGGRRGDSIRRYK
jgi:hypothetical protein